VPTQASSCIPWELAGSSFWILWSAHEKPSSVGFITPAESWNMHPNIKRHRVNLYNTRIKTKCNGENVKYLCINTSILHILRTIIAVSNSCSLHYWWLQLFKWERELDRDREFILSDAFIYLSF
jgi:hypothetical protein